MEQAMPGRSNMSSAVIASAGDAWPVGAAIRHHPPPVICRAWDDGCVGDGREAASEHAYAQIDEHEEVSAGVDVEESRVLRRCICETVKKINVPDPSHARCHLTTHLVSQESSPYEPHTVV
jgi:hypothetical protein